MDISTEILHICLLGLIAFGVTYASVPLVKRLAFKLNAIDYPGHRRVNTVPIPRMGGVAMFLGIAAALAFELLAEALFGWTDLYRSSLLLDVYYPGVLLGLAVVVLTGVIDDIRSLRASLKGLGQFIGACIIVASGVLLASIKNPFDEGFIYFGWWAYPITVLYMMGFMNVINLIDGLDGLAAGIVAIASFALFLIAIGKLRMETAMFAMVIIGATLAFLRYNFNPASIFMGDSGSLFLGAVLSITSLLGVMRTPTVIVLAVSLVIAAIPIMDSIVAVVRRVLTHQPIQQADAKHLHHRLLREGFSVKRAVLLLYAWTAFLAVGAFVLSGSSGMMVLGVFAILLLGSFLILYKIGIFEPVLRHYYNKHGRRPRASAVYDRLLDKETERNKAK